MDHTTQMIAFQKDLEALCERYADEFDLKVEHVIGVLEVAKIRAFINANQDEET